jgi:hypothetical protein
MSFIADIRKQFGDTQWDSDWDNPVWTFAWRHSTSARVWNQSDFIGTRDQVLDHAAALFIRHLSLNEKSIEIKIWLIDNAGKSPSW